MNRFAEEANYWDTTVSPAKSQGEIMEMLGSFGADSTMVAQGRSGGKYAWMIRFQWQERNYRFAFTPLDCSLPDKISSFGGNKRKHQEQAKYQMGRIAVHFVKAILTAAETQPGALFGFLELPNVAAHPGGVPYIASEVDISTFVETIPLLPDLIQGDGEWHNA
ncbi:MAG: hypothetical protein C4575_13060 [Desulforudis sp.]|nr:MAG: hypothetical protein C4575_13060 [Desulforudis sp.]